ncbi:MAG: hypothetical protein NTX44_01620 [Ignavibacteriales bacterium]|nr:hypothetical protein [Ignavibacteriales bacterium]
MNVRLRVGRYVADDKPWDEKDCGVESVESEDHNGQLWMFYPIGDRILR